MGRKAVLVSMVQEALEFHNGSATVKQVGEYIADKYSEVINEDRISGFHGNMITDGPQLH